MRVTAARAYPLLLPLVIAVCGRDVAAPPEPPPPPPPALTVTDTDLLLVPGAEFRVRGGGLSEATVTVADVPAPLLHVSDTLLVVRVPAAPFEPCLADGQTLGVRVSRGTTQRLRTIAAQPRPFRLSLAANAWTLATPVMRAHCAIVLEQPGEYLVMPFRADVTGPSSQLESEVPFAFAYGTPTSGVVARRAASPAAAWSDAGAGGATDVVLTPMSPAGAAARADDLAACAIPTTVGDSARFHLVPGAQWSTDVSAYWWLVARSGRLAVFFDDYTRDLLGRRSDTAERLQLFLSHYDAVASRTLDRYLPPVPDEDGTGRITVFLSARPGRGAALPRNGMREGCTDRGESIWLPLRAATTLGFPTGGWLYTAILHEAAHVAHMGGSSPMPTVRGWVSEGLATLVEGLDELRNHPAPLRANLRSRRDLLRSLSPCMHQARWEPWATEPYTVGCFRLAYALDQAMRETGEELPAVIRRLTRVDGLVPFGAVRRQLAGTTRSEQELTAEWYLARYADDRLPERDPALDIGFWNHPAILEEYRTVWNVPVPPLHDHVLRPGEGYQVGLRPSEAHYIHLTVPANDARALTAQSGSEITEPESGLAILRLP